MLKKKIKKHCFYKHVDVGSYGCSDYVYQTQCNKEYNVMKECCPNCKNITKLK